MSRREKEPWRDSSCDNSCMFGPPGGMATNCGCDCLDAEKDRAKRVRIRKGVLSLRDGIRARNAEIARLREAVSDFLCECALQFSDERLSYETWQITAGAVDELRRALEEKS